MLFVGSANAVWLVIALILLAGLVYLLFRPYKEATKLEMKLKK